MNREQYLLHLTGVVRPWFEAHGSPIPTDVRVSCGWPSRRAFRSQHGRVIGECWPREASQDGHTEIFISPYLSDSIAVGAVLVHELVHAAVGVEHGHRAPYRRLALAIGLQGKMTATVAGPALVESLNGIVADLGSYPHARLDKTNAGIRKQSTRLVKVLCLRCEYTVRITRKWIAVGFPTCPCGGLMRDDV